MSERMREQLNAQDLSLSPITGWTRQHWTTLADHTLRSVRPFASPGHGLIPLPGPVSRSGEHSDALEGWARTFLTAGFRIAGDPGSREAAEHAEWYAKGLVAGTDPTSGDSWPLMADVDQARVEAASIAIGLHETRDVIWSGLTSAQQERVIHWLRGALGVVYPGNNWVWFQNVVQAFLTSVGAPADTADVERNLELIESWYSGDGWYTDGAFPDGEHRCYDYYSGWAMHLYPLWYSRILGPLADPARVESDRDRLRSYLGHAQHLVGTDGGPVYHGRSLTYRFAVLAPFWAGTLFDATPLSPGRTRRLASGVLQHFANHGAWNDDGLQPIGWHGAFPAIRQWYTGSGSPYWSSKGFAGLALPADHPVWTAVEEPLAMEEGDVAQSWPEPGWLVSATREDGVVRVVHHGADHQPSGWLGLDETIYGRVAYSSAAAPDSGLVAETSPVDSCVVLVDGSGRASHRRPVERVEQGAHVAISRHRAHWLVGPARDTWQMTADGRPDLFDVGPWLTVASVLRGAVEVRLVRVDVDDDPATGPALDPVGHRPEMAVGPWWLRVGGYAVASSEPPQDDMGVAPDTAQTSSAVTTSRPLTSTVVGLVGNWVASVQRSDGHNALGQHAAVPLLTACAPVTDGDTAAVAVVLTGLDGGSWGLPTVTLTGDVATVAWPDGQVDRVELKARGD